MESIDAYIAQFPPEVGARLEAIRQVVREAAPQATEKISYQMPAFFFHRILVYFAAYARHVGFYPGASGVAAFLDELSGFKHAKGSVQFPHDQPLPLDLVRRIVEFRLGEVQAKVGSKTAVPKQRR